MLNITYFGGFVNIECLPLRVAKVTVPGSRAKWDIIFIVRFHARSLLKIYRFGAERRNDILLTW